MIRTDFLPSCGYAICQDPAEFPFTTDSVFLGNFPHVVTKASALELGCGTGAVSLLLAARGAAEVTGVDINPRMAELLNRSAALNGLSRTVRAEVLDIRDIKGWCATESFDLVAANPPYRHSGSGRERKVGAIACHEKTAVLEDFFRAAAYALRSRGRFALVQLPDRFMESLELAARFRLQPKRLQWVHSAVDKPAWVFLAEFVKNGSYGLTVLPPLFLYDAGGNLTDQARRAMGETPGVEVPAAEAPREEERHA